jgi:hypothetical protein
VVYRRNLPFVPIARTIGFADFISNHATILRDENGRSTGPCLTGNGRLAA